MNQRFKMTVDFVRGVRVEGDGQEMHGAMAVTIAVTSHIDGEPVRAVASSRGASLDAAFRKLPESVRYHFQDAW